MSREINMAQIVRIQSDFAYCIRNKINGAELPVKDSAAGTFTLTCSRPVIDDAPRICGHQSRQRSDGYRDRPRDRRCQTGEKNLHIIAGRGGLGGQIDRIVLIQNPRIKYRRGILRQRHRERITHLAIDHSHHTGLRRGTQRRGRQHINLRRSVIGNAGGECVERHLDIRPRQAHAKDGDIRTRRNGTRL